MRHGKWHAEGGRRGGGSENPPESQLWDGHSIKRIVLKNNYGWHRNHGLGCPRHASHGDDPVHHQVFENSLAQHPGQDKKEVVLWGTVILTQTRAMGQQLQMSWRKLLKLGIRRWTRSGVFKASLHTDWPKEWMIIIKKKVPSFQVLNLPDRHLQQYRKGN